MKKIILILALAFSGFISANAQSKIYCELLGTRQFLSKKVTISIDFGQQTKLFSDNRMVDENGNVIVFNSMIDAMNYMGNLGWEFEQAYVVTVGSGSSSSLVYHWLLSKYVGEDGDDHTLKTKATLKQEQKDAEQAALNAESQEKRE